MQSFISFSPLSPPPSVQQYRPLNTIDLTGVIKNLKVTSANVVFFKFTTFSFFFVVNHQIMLLNVRLPRLEFNHATEDCGLNTLESSLLFFDAKKDFVRRSSRKNSGLTRPLLFEGLKRVLRAAAEMVRALREEEALLVLSKLRCV